MGKGKETVLRVIRSASRDETGAPLTGEIITSFIRGVDGVNINFKCSLNAHAESLVEEETNETGVISLRFRYLTTPPPTLPIYRYEKVTTVRVSCVVPVAWLFGIFVQMPSLETVSFGMGCFEDERCDWPAQYNIKLEQCPHVKELKIEVNILKFQGLDEESQRTVKNRIYAIFDNVTTSFPKLLKVDFCLPLDVDLTRFLNHFLSLKATGYTTIDNAAQKKTYSSNTLRPQAKKSAPRRASNPPPSSSTSDQKIRQKTDPAEAAGSNFYAQTTRVPGPPAGTATAKFRNRKKILPKNVKLEPGEIDSEHEIIDLLDSDDDEHRPRSTTIEIIEPERIRRASEGYGQSRAKRPESPSLLAQDELQEKRRR